ncbi:MAG: YqaE/Pmp3 family membrane protein [Bradymonadaceae bacterium]|nr:YqaE/Pmp3 family membrane protein [Lujinxingiaceae bacterium]
MTLIRIILCLIFPPLAVFLTVGVQLHFWLNIVLTLLGGIPGRVHALWIVATNSD